MIKDSKAFSGFSVKDLDAAKAFYGGKVGVDVRSGPRGSLQLHLATGTMVFIYSKNDHVPATYTMLNFPVSDVEAAVDELAKAGIKMERYPNLGQDAKGIVRGNGPDIAWFKDPSGNVLSVLKADAR